MSGGPPVPTVGQDAVVFAIDHPYEDTVEAVTSIEKADLPPRTKEKTIHGDARRALGIRNPPTALIPSVYEPVTAAGPNREGTQRQQARDARSMT
ncbi:hypothetical protein [Streptomyces sp. HPF1205]|uniref:hypothetical protein n=1 Tax=Streptomyces sp. HPF1205 TaxID=2873262 RepID=UPI001CEC7132|nr:hypothetical protein [Streptomyces sp. HPF1205]